MSDNAAPRFSIVDTIGLVFSVVGLMWATVAVLVFQPTYQKMFEDFGGSLPVPTDIFLRPVVPFALALVAPLLVGACIALNAWRGARIAVMVASILLALGLPAAFLLAMYLPLVALAGAVK